MLSKPASHSRNPTDWLCVLIKEMKKRFPVKPRGHLFLDIFNFQITSSHHFTSVKLARITIFILLNVSKLVLLGVIACRQSVCLPVGSPSSSGPRSTRHPSGSLFSLFTKSSRRQNSGYRVWPPAGQSWGALEGHLESVNRHANGAQPNTATEI